MLKRNCGLRIASPRAMVKWHEFSPMVDRKCLLVLAGIVVHLNIDAVMIVAHARDNSNLQI